MADQLRAAIVAELEQEDGPSEYELAREAGISQGSLTRFLRRERDWTLATADQVVEVLGLELARSRFTRQARTPEKAQRRATEPGGAAAIAAEPPPVEVLSEP